MIALIDYGAGNLTSVRKGFSAVGAELVTPEAPAALAGVSGIVVPGVGHFSRTAALQNGWCDAIAGAVSRGTPLLGICLGLQWLFDASDEAPEVPGFGAIRGRCTRLPAGQKVPHVGWNSLELLRPSRLLEGLSNETQVYYTHTYAAPVTSETTAATTHGARFASVVENGLVFGVQFHPEKSGPAGLRLLRNFTALCSRSG